MRPPEQGEPRRRWDIFCRVVDNYGDIGVCWRLARALRAEHGQSVRIWVDDMAAFLRLCPGTGEASGSVCVEAVEVRAWSEPFDAVTPSEVADVVIEAFACELPATYVSAMAQRGGARPVWINLEYLSAEHWVEGCHGMASPHPRLPLTKYFYFPGFTPGTGGLLRERGLLDERDAFQGERARHEIAGAYGLAAVPDEALLVSLFAYEQAQLGALLRCWADGPRPVVLVVPEGRVVAELAAFFGAQLAARASRCAGALRVDIVPFVEQRAYDRLLWACDLNFVRGEDSFVRALWAGQPCVWHIYRQDEAIHLVKLEAFLRRYTATLESSPAAALRAFWQAWNGMGESVPEAWEPFVAALPALRRHARGFSAGLAKREDLATALVKFCRARVE